MRTTINLSDDVLERAREIADKKGKPLRYIINEALRVGLTIEEQPLKKKKYHTQPLDMGLKPGYNLDNIQELLSRLEGESSR
ncbi:MAG: DUF2191 domain-containing protein [Spirochaetes bacterium]|nr:MAG: DUF2191 domain-containing protein [Spirochaetota bacterium]